LLADSSKSINNKVFSYSKMKTEEISF